MKGSAPRGWAGALVTFIVTILDFEHGFCYKAHRIISLTKDAAARVLAAAGRVRFPRAGRHIPLPGGFGKTPGRHDDRSATLIAGLGQAETDNARLLAASQEARSGAELRRWFAAASAAGERRQTSALRFTRCRARWRGGLD